MTLSDERLREIAAYQPLEFRISGSELISMARELLSRRASPHGEAGDRRSITEALRMMNCPRPCNHRPDEFTVGECVDAGECGCVAGNGLSASPGSSAGAEPYIVVDEDGNALVPDDQAAAIKAAFDAVTPLAPFGKPLRKALKFALASSPPQREGLEEADGWFKLGGDARLGACATEGCGGQPTWRLERDGIGSNYCSGCKAKIEALTGKGGE